MVVYDIYEQNEQTQEDVIGGNRKVTRYHTENKAKAFCFMQEKNKMAGKNIWRVALQVNNRIIFDVDCHGLHKHDSLDIANVKLIHDYYTNVLSVSFKTIKTYSGYHLITKFPYKNNLEWQYDICRVLNPLLETQYLQIYIEAVQKFYRTERDKQKIYGLDRVEFLDYFPKKFRESGLYFGVGDFDIFFAVNVIMKGYYCLRISKKSIDDKPIEIAI